MVSKLHTHNQNSLNHWINHIWHLIIVADFEAEPMKDGESDCGYKGLKCLSFALNLMGPNWRNSKANKRGRSGAVPTALPAAHWER